MRQFALLLLALLAAIAAGCNGGNEKVATQPPATTTSETTTATLESGVRQALRENDQLSGYVLWNNRVPAWATRSTRGPALVTLRQSAADRRRRGIRVRTLVNTLEITSIKVDPSYTKATARGPASARRSASRRLRRAVERVRRRGLSRASSGCR